jgi:hypothetical protein
MRRTFTTLFTVVLFVTGSFPRTAEANKHTLNRRYAFVGFRVCTVASTPFGNDASGAPTIITGDVLRQSSVDAGFFKFNADGTGTQTGRSTTMDLTETTAGASILSISEFSVPFTYLIKDDGILVINFGDGTFTTILGAGKGNTGTLGPRSEQDQLTHRDRDFLAGPSSDIEQQKIITNEPGGGSSTQYRLCTRDGKREILNR